MKTTKKLLFIMFCLFLTSCSINDNSYQENFNNITKPESKLEIQGRWEKIEEYNINEEQDILPLDLEDLFISNDVIGYKDMFIIDPSISSRYVNLESYFTSKLTSFPSKLEITENNARVFKFYNNISSSQEFILLNDGRLLTIYLGNISVYEKKSDLTADEIAEEKQRVTSLTQTGQGLDQAEFGLVLSFRRRDTSVTDTVKHNYYTYYISKTKDQRMANITKVDDVIIPKSTGLWTVSQEVIDNSAGGLTNFRLDANPTFIEDNQKTNYIQDNLYRRIDYVNRDYISVTKFNFGENSIAESYSIYNLHELAAKDPLSITEVAGAAGNDIYTTLFKENANILFSTLNIDIIDLEPDLDNIGMQRIRNGWKFVSGIDQVLDARLGSRVYRKFDLNINPIINMGKADASTIGWRDVLSRRPAAIDSSVSPNNDFVLIQNANTIEFYPIYYNFIGNAPLFTIQNVDGYEIIQVQWVGDENINSYQSEFDKLPKLNNNIIYQ